MVFGHEPSLIELFVEKHVWSDDRQKRCNILLIAELSTLWYVGFQLFFFKVIISLNLMNLFFLSMIHIIVAGRRDTWTILRPIQISI
jgi:hypothetical protein